MPESFEAEDIPAGDKLFRCLHDNDLRRGEIHSGCFRQHGYGAARGMSTNWSKYSGAINCRERARDPEKNSVVSFVKGNLDKVGGLKVSHAPIPDNRAHTNVSWGEENKEEKTRIRNILYNLCKVEIKSPALL